ncbi:hypothetical protein D3C80_1833650 [compost metagenome]
MLHIIIIPVTDIVSGHQVYTGFPAAIIGCIAKLIAGHAYQLHFSQFAVETKLAGVARTHPVMAKLKTVSGFFQIGIVIHFSRLTMHRSESLGR